MKLFAKKIFPALFILLFSVIAANAQTDWIGFYEFAEDGGKTEGGTPIRIFHTLEIREAADGLMATIKSNGYQTSVNLICTAKTENNKIHIYFADYGEDNMFETYKAGDLLLTLEQKSEKEILTFWGKFQPSTAKYEKSGKSYFKKSVKADEEL